MDRIDLSWASGVRSFVLEPDGPVYELAIRKNWRGRYASAVLRSQKGKIIGRIPTRSQLLDGGAIKLPRRDVPLRVRVTSREEVEVIFNGNEPLWREAKAEPAEPETLVRLVRSAGLSALIWGLFGVPVLLGILLIGLWASWPSNYFSMAITVAGFAVFAGGLYQQLSEAVDLVRGERSSVVRALDANPSPIGWVHGTISQAGFSHSVVVHFLDGTERAFGVPGGEREAIIRLLELRAPDAAIGYSSAAEDKYKALCSGAAEKRDSPASRR